MTNLYIDIETIPGQSDWAKQEAADRVKHPATHKKQETIDKWYAENAESSAEDIWRKQSFDGSRGEIICISWALDDGDIQTVSVDGRTEARMLSGFFGSLLFALNGLATSDYTASHITWIGHYVTGFDLRFLWQRCVINNVQPTIRIPYNAKPWSDDVFDTKIEWAGLQSTGTGSLDATCKALGYAGKGDIDGSKVWDYYRDGRIAEIVEYCKDDVHKARLLHKRMTFKGV
jgi:hypothetical protein